MVLLLLLVACAASTPVRIIGMSAIDLLIEDESNRINLYDFGGNVAGLYGDERGSSFEGFLSYGRVSFSDSSGGLEPEITRWGGFLPTDASVTVNTFTALGGLPAGGVFTYRSPQGYAAAARAMYSSTSTYYESSERTDDATSPLFGIAFANHFGTWDAGAMGEYASIKVSNNQDDTEIYASMKTVNGGITMQVSPMFSLGFKGGLGFPAAEMDVFNTDYNASGSAFGGGIQTVGSIPGLAKIGARFDFLNANLSAEATSGNVTVDLGDLHYTDLGIDTRMLFASAFFPLRAGVMVAYGMNHPEFEGEGSSLFDIDMQITTVDVSFGLGYQLPFLLPGFQYSHSNQNSDDKLNDTRVAASTWEVGVGGESSIGPFMLRGGFGMGKADPDTDVDDDEMKHRSLRFGASLAVPLQPYKFEFAFVNTETRPEENPTDSKEVDNSFHLALKLAF